MLTKLKCKLGFHKLKFKDDIHLKDIKGNACGRIIIDQCVNCGKVFTDFAMYTPYYLNHISNKYK